MTHFNFVTQIMASATELLNKHDKSEWYLASVEAQVLQKTEDIVESMVVATDISNVCNVKVWSVTVHKVQPD